MFAQRLKNVGVLFCVNWFRDIYFHALFNSLCTRLKKTNNINYSNSAERRKSISFLSPDYDSENQKIILEKLSKYLHGVKN